jgi:regulator of sigma E protease
LILVAGVFMNFLLAVVLFYSAYKIGMPTAVEEPAEGATISNLQVKINEVSNNSPAASAGLKIGDQITSLKFENQILDAVSSKEVVSFISQHTGKEIILNIKRGKEVLGISVLLRKNPPEGEGPLGIGLSDVAIVSYSFFQSIVKGVIDTFEITILIIITLSGIIYNAFVGAPVGEVLTGPVGIYQITAQTAQMGLVYVINLAALLSINLGIINILPIPALDGGRILFLMIEKIKGKPVGPKLENIIHTVSFALLIALMALVTYKDIVKLIH